MKSITHFYSEYHGHTIDHLERLVEDDHLPAGRNCIYLVGDSTLDNKYWLNRKLEPACNGYEKVLSPPKSVPDVTYWMNRECAERSLPYVAINCAIEESTLGLRQNGNMLPQDAFVQSHVKDADILVVSCGGNDIALRPTAWTIVSMATLLMSPRWAIEWGVAPGLGHFVRLFRDATRRYVEALIKPSGAKPACVVACMLYYLDEQPGGSWADAVLQKLGYDKDPTKLQLVMRVIYERATSQIALEAASGEAVDVVPVALYEALDGRDTRDYAQRVEPSAQGGRKMAKLIHDAIAPLLDTRAVAFGQSQGGARRGGAGAGGAAAVGVVAMPTSVHNRRG